MIREPLVHVKLTWPDGYDAPKDIAEFDLSIEQAFTIFLDRKIVLGAPAVRTPTPRLRRAIAEAEKISAARFTNPDELFDALSAKR